jgi:WD40 repeat protein
MWIAEREYTQGTLQRVLGTTAGGRITSLAFDPSGERLAIGEYDGRLHVWSLAGRPRRVGLLDGTSLQPAGTIREPGRVGEVSSIAFPGALVACASQVMRWDGDPSAIGTTEPAVVENGTLVSRDGSRLVAVGSWGGEPAVVYDADGSERAKLAGIDARDRFSAVSDDGSRVLLAGAFGDTSQISVYAASGERIGTLRIDAQINGALFDRTGCVIGWTLERGPAFRWDPAAQRLERWGAGDFDRYASAHATGGGLIALATRTVVDVRDAAGACRLRIADQEPSALALSDDGTRLAIGHWTGRVRVLDLDPLRELATLCTTCEGGWWVRDADGFAHEPGRKEWA